MLAKKTTKKKTPQVSHLYSTRSKRLWYLTFLVKESIYNPWGGIEGVCRMITAMYDPMGNEFSL